MSITELDESRSDSGAPGSVSNCSSLVLRWTRPKMSPFQDHRRVGWACDDLCARLKEQF